MISDNCMMNRSTGKNRWPILFALLAFSPLSARCQDQKVEVSTDYSYLRANPAGSGGSFNASGGSATAVWNAVPHLGLVADFGGYQFGGQPAGVDAHMLTYTFGPRFSLRSDHGLLHPFGEFLIGGATLTANLGGQPARENGLAVIAGVGVDAHVQTHFSVRIVEVDYLMTRFDRTTNTPSYQNDVRISTGIVFRFSLGR
jgi:Outer membrane protein beta-barrel domain